MHLYDLVLDMFYSSDPRLDNHENDVLFGQEVTCVPYHHL